MVPCGLGCRIKRLIGYLTADMGAKGSIMMAFGYSPSLLEFPFRWNRICRACPSLDEDDEPRSRGGDRLLDSKSNPSAVLSPAVS